MDPRALIRRWAVALVLAAGVVLVAAGCSPPENRATQLVGTWVRADGTSDEVILDLRSDALGTTTLVWPPHGASIRWVVARDKLAVTTMDGTTKARFGFEFEGPDVLVLSEGESTLKLKRAAAGPSDLPEEPSG